MSPLPIVEDFFSLFFFRGGGSSDVTGCQKRKAFVSTQKKIVSFLK